MTGTKQNATKGKTSFEYQIDPMRRKKSETEAPSTIVKFNIQISVRNMAYRRILSLRVPNK